MICNVSMNDNPSTRGEVITRSPEHTIPECTYVFLGGTVGTATWRDGFIEKLASLDPALSNHVFNPLVDEWTPEDKVIEDKAKREADFHIYYLTNPNAVDSTISSYALVEAAARVKEAPEQTLIVFDDTASYPKHLQKQIDATKDLIRSNPDYRLLFGNLDGAAEWLAPRLLKEKQAPISITEKWLSLKLRMLIGKRMLAAQGLKATVEIEEVGGLPQRRAVIARHVAQRMNRKKNVIARVITEERDSNYISITRPQ